MSGETKLFIGMIVATVVILLGAILFFSRPPKEVSVETLVPVDAHATGSANPKATLVEFSDFECPACAAAYPMVKQVVASYSADLKFVFRHFPLDQHTNSKLAAQAAEAAGAQGKFWEMHDLLYENQTTLSQETINGFGIELKLDMDRFTKELTDGIYADKIQKDVSQGSVLGVNSTPTFFLNGKKLSLFSFADLETEVRKELGL